MNTEFSADQCLLLCVHVIHWYET